MAEILEEMKKSKNEKKWLNSYRNSKISVDLNGSLVEIKKYLEGKFVGRNQKKLIL
jgi:hypothetical protein